MEKVLAIVIAAHVISDFCLQTRTLIKRKDEVRYLFIHGLIQATLTYLLVQDWSCWRLPIAAVLLHVLIDFVKQWRGDTAQAFLADQAAHIISLFVLVSVLMQLELLAEFSGYGYAPIICVAGFVATVRGTGFLVTKVTEQIREENDLDLDGLKGGEKLTGELERTLIFLFIILGHPAGVGFLLGAKAILRFNKAREQKLGDYVLISTLASFSAALAIAVITKWALNL